MMSAVCRLHNGITAVFYFMHVTPCRHRHHEDLLSCIKHIGWKALDYCMCSLMTWVNHYNGPMVAFVCLHSTLFHHRHFADISEFIEPKTLVRCIVSSMCPRLSQIAQLSFMQYIGLWIHAYFSCDDCENTCTLCYRHHQIGSMNHLSLFRVRSWKSGRSFFHFL